MPQIKGILFDNDGTLLDTYELILESFNYAYEEVLGHTFPPEEVMQKVGQPLETQVRDFADDDEVVAEVVRVYRDLNVRIHDERATVYEGCIETLAALKDAGIRMCIVTSKRHSLAQHGIEVFGIAPYMEFLLGSDDWPAHKPDPSVVLRGCELLGLDPAECAYVGDSPFDMQAANGAGCFSVAALWGMFDRETLEAENPDALCETFADLPAVLAL